MQNDYVSNFVVAGIPEKPNYASAEQFSWLLLKWFSRMMIDSRPSDCVTSMLALCQEDGITNQEAALTVLGSRFRVALEDRVGPWESSSVGFFVFFARTLQMLSPMDQAKEFIDLEMHA